MKNCQSFWGTAKCEPLSVSNLSDDWPVNYSVYTSSTFSPQHRCFIAFNFLYSCSGWDVTTRVQLNSSITWCRIHNAGKPEINDASCLNITLIAPDVLSRFIVCVTNPIVSCLWMFRRATAFLIRSKFIRDEQNETLSFHFMFNFVRNPCDLISLMQRFSLRSPIINANFNWNRCKQCDFRLN